MDLSALHSVIETCLVWIGFGVVSGLTAKALLPGRDPGGAFVTLILGMVGSLIGVAFFSWLSGHNLKNPISLIGFAVAVGGALVLLLSHRLLSGRMFGRGRRYVDEVVVPEPQIVRRRRRSARYSDVD